ncbi:MAG: prepilin-type N-terminal cleavage/methylation domain-containing protein [Candidatus Wildermuthbacteria bacterium]|nr:prepilin-type N-terminal cleavage/methylation domain-containing protein [Candidatus Wildermuthbacteria bacterium]
MKTHVKKGFTLIELIIYIAIVAAVLTVSSSFAWNVIQGDTKTMAYREVQQNGRFVMEKITRAIRSGQNPSIFTVQNGIIYQSGAALTTDQVRVTDLRFTSIADTYRINLSIQYFNPAGRDEYSASIDLESTTAHRP